MRTIEISDHLFQRLQKIATPLVDTEESLIVKLLDCFERNRESLSNGESSSVSTTTRTDFDPDEPPDLSYTRVLVAQAEGQNASSWNKLVYVVHRRALVHLKSFKAVQAATRSNIVEGRKSDRGFRFYKDIDVSIQNSDANVAWRNALNLAKTIGIPITVTFEWRDKAGIVHRGAQGTMSWSADEDANSAAVAAQNTTATPHSFYLSGEYNQFEMPDPLIRTCVKCGQRNKIRPNHLGRVLRCGACKAMLNLDEASL